MQRGLRKLAKVNSCNHDKTWGKSHFALANNDRSEGMRDGIYVSPQITLRIMAVLMLLMFC